MLYLIETRSDIFICSLQVQLSCHEKIRQKNIINIRISVMKTELIEYQREKEHKVRYYRLFVV